MVQATDEFLKLLQNIFAIYQLMTLCNWHQASALPVGSIQVLYT